jgi:O-antigen/teichoic acid export membrane protein
MRFVLQIGSLVILARLLTPHDFGVVAMVTTITGIAAILRDFGLSAIQATKLSDAERSNLFWMNVAVGVSCGLALVATAPLIQRLYGQSGLTPIVYALSTVFVISGVNTQFGAELARELRFKALAFADISAQACGIVAAISLALLNAGYWAIVAQQIVVALMTLTLNASACRWRPGRYKRSVSITRFFKFSGGVLGVQLISYLTMNIDNVAIGAYWGANALGLYSRAYQLLMTPLNQINAPLTRVVLPVLSRVQNNQKLFERYVHRAQLVACYVTATVFTVCAALAVPLTAVLFGPKWNGVAPIFALLAIGGVFRSIAQISYWIYLARDKTVAQLRLYLVIRPIMIAIILAGLPWGAEGVAAACSVAYFLYWVASLWHVSRRAHVRAAPLFQTAAHAVLLLCVPCGLAAWLATLFVGPAILQLVVGVLLAGLALLVSAAVFPSVREDLAIMIDIVVRNVNRLEANRARRRYVGRHTAEPAAPKPQTVRTRPSSPSAVRQPR